MLIEASWISNLHEISIKYWICPCFTMSWHTCVCINTSYPITLLSPFIKSSALLLFFRRRFVLCSVVDSTDKGWYCWVGTCLYSDAFAAMMFPNTSRSSRSILLYCFWCLSFICTMHRRYALCLLIYILYSLSWGSRYILLQLVLYLWLHLLVICSQEQQTRTSSWVLAVNSTLWKIRSFLPFRSFNILSIWPWTIQKRNPPETSASSKKNAPNNPNVKLCVHFLLHVRDYCHIILSIHNTFYLVYSVLRCTFIENVFIKVSKQGTCVNHESITIPN